MSSGVRFLKNNNLVYIFAAIASLVLSFWINVRETVINPDAICYLYSAEEIGKAGLHAAMHICPQAMWPFYSVLIYGVVKLTHLSFTTAAFTVDALFSCISVLTFIAIIKELGGTRRILWLAALVILLAHEFNSVRQYIIRDHGFWAFYLISFWCLLRYFKVPNLMNALSWSISLCVATLFRIEGAIFLLVLPFTVWLLTDESWRDRLRRFLSLNSLLLMIGLLISGWLLLHTQETLTKLGRVAEVPHQLLHGLQLMVNKYHETEAAVVHNVLSTSSARDASLVVMLTFLAWYVVNVIGNLSWIFALLFVYVLYVKAANWNSKARLAVLAYLIVNIAITAGFFAENLFLAKRYLIALSLVFMLWLPFGLEKLWRQRSRVGFYIVSVLILISACGGIFHFGHNKDYIRQAGDWLAASVPVNANLYANDYQLMYYSQHFGTDIFSQIHVYKNVAALTNYHWKQYDYLALLTSKKKEDQAARVIQEIHLRPLRIFMSNNGNAIYIYRIPHEERKS